MTETFGIQVNIKTKNGSLLNVRGDSGDEVSSRLEDLAKLSQQVHELENLFEAAAALQGAGMFRNGNGGQQNGQRPAQTQQAPQQSAPPGQQGKVCGECMSPMVFKSGTSQKTGKEWKRWDCSSGNDAHKQWVR